jgi:pyruvate/2-oxoglutarate dehydrogenase complex dihydrolipoamide acyltransferase (E2) component
VGAASFGTISFIGWGGPSGNLVKIQHSGGIETGYAHLSRYVEGLKVGDKVKRLQVIGYVGSTGRSTGPHLHFSAHRDGKFFDAETLNLDSMRTLTKEERVAFAQVTAKYNPLLDALPLPDALPAPPTAAAAEKPSAPDVGAADPAAEADEHEEPAPPAAPGNAPPAQPAAPAPNAPRSGNSVYLTDQELLKMQSASDDGEVAD